MMASFMRVSQKLVFH